MHNGASPLKQRQLHNLKN